MKRYLARIFHETAAATADMPVLPGVLGSSFGFAQDRLTLRRTVQVRLGSNPLAVARWHGPLHGLTTQIHKISGLTILVVFVWVLLGTCPGAFATTFDHSDFDRILNEYVDDKGLVDYNGIAKDQLFSKYMESLKTAGVEELSRNGQLAFWINAYNAVTIDKVIKTKPKKSVRETFVPGVWTSTKFFTTREHTVAGRRLSQDDIEHDILRKQFKEPRIHFAIICASSGCPQLPRSAYTAQNVQDRLEEETRKYLNSPRGTRVDQAENTLYVSKLFDWFAGDFINTSGSTLAFMEPYLNEGTRMFLKRNPKISYLEYNWALNAQEPLKR